MSVRECPFCKRQDVRVIDSRPSPRGCRRRYQCNFTKCGQRFSTLEQYRDHAYDRNFNMLIAQVALMKSTIDQFEKMLRQESAMQKPYEDMKP